jgi:O-acetylhomoserine/O-acetylserine sulfhydrylase-like pyridoxal-dependent enzyme
MRNLIRKTRVQVAIGGVALLVVAGGAYAYFTSSGGGTGAATVGTSTPIVVHGTSASTLYPGTSSVVSFTVDNASPGAQFVNKIQLASVAADASHPTCATVLNTDFSMPDVTVARDFATGLGQTVTQTGTITMADTGISQDGCKGATLTLTFATT